MNKNKEINEQIEKYMGLKESQKKLNAQIDALKKTLMGLDGSSTDLYSITVLAQASERVVNKDTLIDALGIEVVDKKGLLKEIISYTLKIITK